MGTFSFFKRPVRPSELKPQKKHLLNRQEISDMPSFRLDGIPLKIYGEVEEINWDYFAPGNHVLDITGKAIPEFATKAWTPFLEFLTEYVTRYSMLTINFKLAYFTSASGRYISGMLAILLENSATCTATINWCYTELDEFSLINGEMYQEFFPQLNIKMVEVETL